MKALTLNAPAKLNLTLDILRRRADGYHDLEMVMFSVDLCDRVTVGLREDGKILVRAPGTDLPAGEDNLAGKAARAFFNETGSTPGADITLEKRIPAQAGMGGGSSDAAAVLRALNRYYDAPLSIMALAELGALVGSDVPFCVLGGTAMVEGRGERLRKLPDMPDCTFVICKPDFSVSTPELYQKIDTVAIADRPDNRAMEAAILAGDLGKVAENVCNVFDPVVTSDHLELNYIKSVCHSYGALAQQMTGSGSAIFAIMDSFEYAAVVCNMLKENYPRVFIGKPV